MILKNFSSGILASGIGTGDTTIVVNAGNTLPSIAGTFTATIWNNVTYADPSQDPNAEIILGVYASANTYTITRAQESTPAVAHSAGAVVGLYLTAGVLQDGTSANKLVRLDNSGKYPTPDGGSNLLGSWVDKSSDHANQQAATDGIVCATALAATRSDVIGLTNTGSPASVQRIVDGDIPKNDGDQRRPRGITMPVHKGDYWTVTGADAVYWIPLGL